MITSVQLVVGKQFMIQDGAMTWTGEGESCLSGATTALVAQWSYVCGRSICWLGCLG